jgi:hypothetical protein
MCASINFHDPHTYQFVIQPGSADQAMDQDINSSQHHSVLLNENNSADVQTKPIFNVRDDTSDDASLRQIPNLLAPAPVHDLSKTIKGMYRILDLVSEQGSGGLGKMHAPDLCSRN